MIKELKNMLADAIKALEEETKCYNCSDEKESWESASDEEIDHALKMAEEYDAYLEEEGVIPEDKKLSTEKRKKLPDSAFCGPNRSFPVPDCAHVTAARRLIGRYKGPGDKNKILACVNRKAKSMGCDKNKKDSLDPFKNLIQTKEEKNSDRIKNLSRKIFGGK